MPFLVGFLTFLVLTFAGNAIVGPAVCNDGWASPSIGRQGACSHHGGVNELPKYLVLIFAGFGGVIAGSYYSGIQSRSGSIHKHPDNHSTHKNFEIETPFNDEVEMPRVDVEDKISCPLCGADMVERTAQKGRYQGNQFFGCSRYPKCKGLINKDEIDE